jgi:hypothetical protein
LVTIGTVAEKDLAYDHFAALLPVVVVLASSASRRSAAKVALTIGPYRNREDFLRTGPRAGSGPTQSKIEVRRPQARYTHEFELEVGYPIAVEIALHQHRANLKDIVQLGSLAREGISNAARPLRLGLFVALTHQTEQLGRIPDGLEAGRSFRKIVPLLVPAATNEFAVRVRSRGPLSAGAPTLCVRASDLSRRECRRHVHELSPLGRGVANATAASMRQI